MGDHATTPAELALGLNPGTFPFESHFAEVDGARLHYIDVAEDHDGPTMLFLHGNPTWSILYRDLINNLKDACRCIAVDLAGFGLSKAPPGFSFLPEDHAKLITALVEQLDVKDTALVAHDWGGPIGLAAMFATEGRITRLCLGNT